MNRLLGVLLAGCVLSAIGSELLGGALAQDAKDSKPAFPKVSQNGVDFEIISSKVSGNNWELTIVAFTEEGRKMVRFRKSRAITEDGKTVENNYLKMMALKLPVGQKIQIKLEMGQVPDSITRFATVELDDFFSKRQATVFKNVRIDR